MPLEYRCTALPMAHKTVHDGETRVRRGRRGRGHFPRFTHLNFGVIIVRRRHLLSEDDIIISPESGCIIHYPGPVGSWQVDPDPRPKRNSRIQILSPDPWSIANDLAVMFWKILFL